MASDLTLAQPAGLRTALPLWRWAGLGVLLAAELVALTTRFDGEMLYRQSGLWARLVSLTHHVPYLAIAIATALALLAGKSLREELVHSAGAIGARSRTWPYLVAHLGAFSIFARLTRVLLESDYSSLDDPGLWAAGWFVSGGVMLAFWGLAALPARVWGRLALHGWLGLLVGTAVGLAAWAVGHGAGGLWDELGGVTFDLVHFLMRLLFTDVYCNADQALLGTSTFYVYIAPECSGYEGIGLIWVFLGAYLWYFRRELRFPQAFLLIPFGTAVMYLANALRIVALVAVGTYISPKIALGGFHSQAGWLAFNAVALGTVFVTRRFGLFARGSLVARPEAATANPTAAYVVPLLALVGMTMISTAFSTGFDWLYPARVLVVAAILWHFRSAYRALSWSWSVAPIMLGAAVFVVWLMLEPLAVDVSVGDSLAEGLNGLPRFWAAAWLIARVLGSVVTVPLAEELAFRAYLVRRLQSREFDRLPFMSFTWSAFLISSVLFGLLHGRWFAGTLAGMVYAAAMYRRGKPMDAVLAHAVTNALIAMYVLATGTWSLWS